MPTQVADFARRSSRPAGDELVPVCDAMLSHTVVSVVLAERCRSVVALELARLGRRRPGLTSSELAVVGAALSDLAEGLVLDPVRRHPGHADSLGALFAIDHHDLPERGRP